MAAGDGHRGETKVATTGFPRWRPGLEAWRTASPGVWDVNTRWQFSSPL